MRGRAPRAPASAPPCPAGGRSSCGSSASTVPMPTRMASHLRAQQMHARPHRLAGDRDRLVARRADLVVGGDRQLQDHMRALVADAAEMPGVIARGFRGAQADIDRDAGGAQSRMPLPGHFRIGIFDRRRPPARCRRRSPHRRRAATCRNASRAPASHRAWRRARPRRPAPAPPARHAAGRRAGSSRGRR